MWLIKCKEGHIEIVGTALNENDALIAAGQLNARYQTDAYYIDQKDGGFRVQDVDAEDSRIYESSGKPYLKVTHTDYMVWWYVPFPISDDYKYEFHVPKGSVLSDYTITNR